MISSKENSTPARSTYWGLQSLTIYRNLLSDKVIASLLALLEYASCSQTPDPGEFIRLYGTFCFSLNSSSPDGSLKDLIIDKIMLDENKFSLLSESVRFADMREPLKHMARLDLENLYRAASLTPAELKSEFLYRLSAFKSSYTLPENINVVIEALPAWENAHMPEKAGDSSTAAATLHSSDDWGGYCGLIADRHFNWGCGDFSNHSAFIWVKDEGKGFLKAVENPDTVKLSDFTGYEEERSEIVGNTLQFLSGFPANNVLLYGDRGTGKSSTVKALANEYFDKGLRIVEVQKKHLCDFPDIINQLKSRKQKFIIFIDDLVFDDNESDYTAMKAVLEGGLEIKPANVLIYATSNRRHLVKEKFSDRAGLSSGDRDDEIRSGDTIQEKLSLSDRFGITVVYSSPDKKKYLEIVDALAKKRGLDADPELLHKEALKWELWYNGRSPRTARQFIDWYTGHAGLL